MDLTVSSAAPSRAANVLHLAPPDPVRIAEIALPALAAAMADGASGLRTLILVEDAETAVAIATHAASDVGGGLTPIVALTGAARARRVLTAALPSAAVMTIEVAAALIARSALPLGDLRQLIVAMPDAAGQRGVIDALDAVMAEMPKGAIRTLVAARETPEVASVVERHFFKARRTREAAPEAARPDDRPLHVLATANASRWDALRQILDEVDPPSAAVLTRDAATQAEASRVLASLGYPPDGLVQAIRDDVPAGITLVVIVGVPDAAALRTALDAVPTHVIVLCAPRDIAGLRTIAGNGVITPWLLEGPLARAESRSAATRARLREILTSGEYASELKALTPLLRDFDSSEVAAAALVMVSELSRSPVATAPAAPPRPPAPRPPLSRDAEARPPRDAERRPSRPAGDRGGRPTDPRDRPRGGPRGGPRSYGDRPRDDRPRGDRAGSDRPRGDRPRDDRPRGDRPGSDRPRGDRPRNDRSDRPRGDRPRR